MDNYFKNFKGCNHFGEISRKMCNKIHTKMLELKSQKDKNEIDLLIEHHDPDAHFANPKNCYDLPDKEMNECLAHHQYMQKILEDKNKNNNDIQHDIDKTLKKNDLVQLMNGKFKNMIASKCKESLKDKQKKGNLVILKCEQKDLGMITSDTDIFREFNNIVAPEEYRNDFWNSDDYWYFDEYGAIIEQFHFFGNKEIWFNCRNINRI